MGNIDPSPKPGTLDITRDSYDVESLTADRINSTPGINLVYDQEVDPTSGQTVTFTPTHGLTHTYVILDHIGQNTNNTVDIEIRINGDSGANYDWESPESFTSGDNAWLLASPSREDLIQQSGAFRISGQQSGTSWGANQTFITNAGYAGDANGGSSVLQQGRFTGADSGIVTQITFRWIDSGSSDGPSDGTIFVYGAEVPIFG